MALLVAQTILSNYIKINEKLIIKDVEISDRGLIWGFIPTSYRDWFVPRRPSVTIAGSGFESGSYRILEVMDFRCR